MVVVMTCSTSWYKYLVIDIYSLLESTKAINKIYILVSDSSLDIPYLDYLREKYDILINVVDITNIYKEKFNDTSPNIVSDRIDFSLVKFLIPDVIKEDKVLYLDTDLIVKKDISNVWKYDINNYYIAGVMDFSVYDDEHDIDDGDRYINSGFMIMNLKELRNDMISTSWYKIINSLPYIHINDVLNKLIKNKLFFLPSVYNYCSVTMNVYNTDLIKAYHFIGEKDNWVMNKTNGEEWYEVEERFNDEIK